MTKFIYLIAGITFALGLKAHKPNRLKSSTIKDKGAWIVFTDHKNQVWSLLESEWQEYGEALHNGTSFTFCQVSITAACTRFKQAEGYAIQAGLLPRFLYSRKRYRLLLSNKKIRLM
jgi:hypothetical protein